jgi:hypothetical protein
MSIDPQQLAAAVLAGNVRQVRSLLRDATEADRRECAESLKSFLISPEIYRRPTGRDYKGLTEEEHVLLTRRYTRLSAAVVAAKSGLADGLRTALMAADGVQSWISPSEDDFDEIANVYADRRPPWLAELVDRRLQEQLVGNPLYVGGQGGAGSVVRGQASGAAGRYRPARDCAVHDPDARRPVPGTGDCGAAEGAACGVVPSAGRPAG